MKQFYVSVSVLQDVKNKGEGKINRQMRLYAQIGFKFCIRGSFRCIKINVSLKVDLPPKKPSIKHGSFL